MTEIPLQNPNELKESDGFSDAFKNTFGRQRIDKQRKRDLTPAEAINELKNHPQGRDKAYVAKTTGLARGSTIIKYLTDIGALPIDDFALYLSEFWSESIYESKRRNHPVFNRDNEDEKLAKLPKNVRLPLLKRQSKLSKMRRVIIIQIGKTIMGN